MDSQLSRAENMFYNIFCAAGIKKRDHVGTVVLVWSRVWGGVGRSA